MVDRYLANRDVLSIKRKIDPPKVILVCMSNLRLVLNDKRAATLMPTTIYLSLLSSLVVKLAVHILLKSVGYLQLTISQLRLK